MSGIHADMNANELNLRIEQLGTSQSELAGRLGVTTRTVRRWQSGQQPVPTWVVEVIEAWLQLHERCLPWGADLDSVWFGDDEQIALHQDHDKALADLLSRVEARSTSRAPWRVDLVGHTAKLEQICVRFYSLKSGSFSLASYGRSDMSPDARRDKDLIEDAVAAFAAARAVTGSR